MWSTHSDPVCVARTVACKTLDQIVWQSKRNESEHNKLFNQGDFLMSLERFPNLITGCMINISGNKENLMMAELFLFHLPNMCSPSNNGTQIKCTTETNQIDIAKSKWIPTQGYRIIQEYVPVAEAKKFKTNHSKNEKNTLLDFSLYLCIFSPFVLHSNSFFCTKIPTISEFIFTQWLCQLHGFQKSISPQNKVKKVKPKLFLTWVLSKVQVSDLGWQKWLLDASWASSHCTETPA